MALTNLSQITTSGISTLADINLNNLTGVAATFTGNVTIGGTLTYDDVTNIDSVGLITARSGVSITGGQLTLPDSIVHAGNDNAKIRFPAADTVTVETGGTERFRILSGGQVVIGDDAADHASTNFDDLVVGNSSSAKRTGITLVCANNQDAAICFSDGTGASDKQRGRIIYMHDPSSSSNEYLDFYVAGSHKLKLDGDGRIVMGTNGGSSQIASAKIQVVGVSGSNDIAIINSAASDSDGARSGNLLFRGSQSGNEKSTLAALMASHEGSADDQKGNLIFKTNDGSDGDSPTERLRITSDGKVGIGTVNPAAELEVYGNGRFKDADGSHGIELYPDVASLGYQRIISYNRTSSAYEDLSFGVNDFVVTSGTSEKLRITSAGKVGIGLTNPINLFHVKGANTIARFQSSTSYVDVMFQNTGATNGFIQYNNSGNFNFYANSGSTPTLSITAGSPGNVGINTTAPNTKLQIVTTSGARALTLTAPTLGPYMVFETDGTAFADIGSLSGLIGSGSDTDTLALNARGSRDLAFRTNSNERLRITSDGKIGIGHHSATQITKELTIRPANDGGIMIGRPGDTVTPINAHLLLTTTTSGSAFPSGEAYTVKYNTRNCDAIFTTFAGGGTGGNISFQTGSGNGNEAERLRITSNGVLSFKNSSPPAWSTDSGYANATFGSSAYLRTDTDVNSNFLSIGSNAYRHAGGWKHTNAGWATQLQTTANSGDLAYSVSATSGSADGTVSWKERLRITGAGTLRITGETDFYTDIIGNSQTVTSGVREAGCRFIGPENRRMYFEIRGNDDTDHFRFITSPNNDAALDHVAMHIGNNGNIGINEINPIGDLSITGANGSTMEFQPDIVSNVNRLTNYNRSTSTYKNFRLDAARHEILISGTEKLRIHSSGKISVGTNTNVLYGDLQVNQSAGNDESGIGILASNQARSMRLWCDDASNSIINSGDGGSGVLKLNEGAGQVRIGSGGLTFNGDSSTANALNDYEEGTLNWRLQRNNSYAGTNSVNDLKYTKIGNRVFVSGYLYTQNTGSATGVQVQLRDNSNTANPATLPYTPNHEGGFTVTGTRTINDSYRNISVTFMKNNTRVYVYTDDGNNAYNKNNDNVNIDSAQTHLVLIFNGSYTTDS